MHQWSILPQQCTTSMHLEGTCCCIGYKLLPIILSHAVRANTSPWQKWLLWSFHLEHEILYPCLTKATMAPGWPPVFCGTPLWSLIGEGGKICWCSSIWHKSAGKHVITMICFIGHSIVMWSTGVIVMASWVAMKVQLPQLKKSNNPKWRKWKKLLWEMAAIVWLWALSTLIYTVVIDWLQSLHLNWAHWCLHQVVLLEFSTWFFLPWFMWH